MSIGATRFELATSWTQTRRSSQAELRPGNSHGPLSRAGRRMSTAGGARAGLRGLQTIGAAAVACHWVRGSGACDDARMRELSFDSRVGACITDAVSWSGASFGFWFSWY